MPSVFRTRNAQERTGLKAWVDFDVRDQEEMAELSEGKLEA